MFSRFLKRYRDDGDEVRQTVKKAKTARGRNDAAAVVEEDDEVQLDEPERANKAEHEISNDTESETKHVTGFFNLAREIRDEIYALGHGMPSADAPFQQEGDRVCGEPSPNFKLISHEDWVRIERGRRRRASNRTARSVRALSESQTYPAACPLDALMVSRQWYGEASTAWIRRHTFVIEQHDNFLRDTILTICNERMATNTLSLELVWDQKNKSRGFGNLARFSALRRVTFHVSETAFDKVANKLSCVHEFNRKDFMKLSGAKTVIESLHHVDEIRLVAIPSKYAKSEEEREQWSRNVASLESFLRREIKRDIRRSKGKMEAAQANAGELSRQDKEPVERTSSLGQSVAFFRNEHPEIAAGMLAWSLANTAALIYLFSRLE